ncbi:unnamed protein product [Clonostachys byssicola]|uniref:Uncharacterized protein n=1 Tax=Clonostachys byssicola TaxID=160290 RepID=A0A9N9Y0T2_9HYPO|nr:unnamed protein product [Clonostachys byssicola]
MAGLFSPGVNQSKPGTGLTTPLSPPTPPPLPLCCTYCFRLFVGGDKDLADGGQPVAQGIGELMMAFCLRSIVLEDAGGCAQSRPGSNLQYATIAISSIALDIGVEVEDEGALVAVAVGQVSGAAASLDKLTHGEEAKLCLVSGRVRVCPHDELLALSSNDAASIRCGLGSRCTV